VYVLRWPDEEKAMTVQTQMTTPAILLVEDTQDLAELIMREPDGLRAQELRTAEAPRYL
jgi:hypothetical protein